MLLARDIGTVGPYRSAQGPRPEPRTVTDAAALPSRSGYLSGMCRSIVTLHRAETPATEDEVRAAALQFVRKVSGYRAPSRANTAAFDEAIDEVADATRRLLESLSPRRA
jgi:hypothetical protein